jgi:mannose-6-phosphate isomerase-like protein (cupin superfamily)
MKIARLQAELKQLVKVSDEISYKNVFDGRQFTSGVIVFRPAKGANRKQIEHPDKDVVCHVLRGRGRLRVRNRRFPLVPGTVCHIPCRTPHDFAAESRTALVMFYSLIQRDPKAVRGARR